MSSTGNCIGHILLRNCLLKHIIEEIAYGREEKEEEEERRRRVKRRGRRRRVKRIRRRGGRRRRRHKQLLDDLKESIGYRKLKYKKPK